MTFELFLNLTWLFIAIAAGVRFAQWSDGQTRQRRRAVCVAMICALALLFPIISVTDDLHSDAAVLEENSAIRRTANTVQNAFVALPDALLPVDSLPSLSVASLLAVLLSPRITRSPQLLDGVWTAAGVRPPPALSV